MILEADDGQARLVLEDLIDDAPTVYVKEGISFAVRARYVTVPDALLDVWLLDHSSYNNYSVGGEIGIDGPGGSRVVFGVDYTDLHMPSGNWRNDGDRPDEASYTEIDLGLVAFDVTFLWKLALAEAFGFTGGVGVGVGYLMGDVTSVDVLPTCTHPVAECGHWNNVTKRQQEIPPSWYPTRFIPLLSLQGGLYVAPTKGFQLRADVGYRLLLLYTGISARAAF